MHAPDVRPPTREEIEELAPDHSLALADDELDDVAEVARRAIGAFERLEELPDPAAQSPDRDPGRPPTAEEDPFNAFVTRCAVSEATEGPLAGYDVGLKDNVALAGVEMTLGSDVLSGYRPSFDATVVERLLAAGATVVGKLNMDDSAVSGSGELSATGPIRNPRDPAHLAGGSSGGPAAAVATGDVDLAFGTDGAGSVRIPAAWCGVVGLKPTRGLVPFTGIVSLGKTIDHVGPLASDVRTVALGLDVVAGPDERDPHGGHREPESYGAALPGDPEDVTVGVLREGFGRDASDEAVDRTVRRALDRFESAGATITEVSVERHRDGLPIWNGIALTEATAMIESDAIGHFGSGYYDVGLADAYGRARRERGDRQGSVLKFILVLGEYLAEEYRHRHYAKAQNLGRDLRSRYDRALEAVDVLAVPTTPQLPLEYREDLPRRAAMGRAMAMLGNTAPFNVTGHPVVSVPAGRVADLPVGVSFVGRHGEDGALLRAAHAFERRE
ncbi:MAG: amidase [Halanaeroarchaeum sp.]